MRAGGFARPYEGLTVCGDSFVVERHDGVLVSAVIDGLGHGAESAQASAVAVEVIRSNLELGAGEIVERCHREMRATRGAAIGLLRLDSDGSGEFCGVGNVDVQAVHGKSPGVFCVAGIVGHNARKIRPQPFSMEPEDIYCLLSDGVSSRGDFKECLPGAAATVARRIVDRWGYRHDDATALIVGFRAAAIEFEDGVAKP